MNRLVSFIYLFISIYTWNSSGHFLVARIAQIEIQQYNKELDQKLIDLLKVLQPFTNKEEKYPFIECSSFPDDIKYIKWNSFNDWHFQEDYIYSSDYEGIPIKSSNSKIIQAINNAKSTLRNTTRCLIDDRLGKSFELRYLIHLIGDVHQPLHSVSRVCKNNQNGDAGGTQFFINFQTCENLHMAWDKTFNIYREVKAPLNEKDYQYINEEAINLMKKFSRENLENKLKLKEIKDWLIESKTLAQEHVYNGINNKEAPSESYISKIRPIIQQQLVIAGYRLADFLLNVFKDKKVLESHFVQSTKNTDDSKDSKKEKFLQNNKIMNDPQNVDTEKNGKGKRKSKQKRPSSKPNQELNLKDNFQHQNLLKSKEELNYLGSKEKKEEQNKTNELVNTLKLKGNYERSKTQMKKKQNEKCCADSSLMKNGTNLNPQISLKLQQRKNGQSDQQRKGNNEEFVPSIFDGHQGHSLNSQQKKDILSVMHKEDNNDELLFVKSDNQLENSSNESLLFRQQVPPNNNNETGEHSSVEFIKVDQPSSKQTIDNWISLTNQNNKATVENSAKNFKEGLLINSQKKISKQEFPINQKNIKKEELAQEENQVKNIKNKRQDNQ